MKHFYVDKNPASNLIIDWGDKQLGMD